MDAIKDNIANGSIIYSDSWKGYQTKELKKANFDHFKVNHRYNFVDPETGVHTQTIERMWGSAKWRNKKQRGTKREYLDSYFAEFMCRLRMKTFEKKEGGIFKCVLKLLASTFPPETVF